MKNLIIITAKANNTRLVWLCLWLFVLLLTVSAFTACGVPLSDEGSAGQPTNETSDADTTETQEPAVSSTEPATPSASEPVTDPTRCTEEHHLNLHVTNRIEASCFSEGYTLCECSACQTGYIRTDITPQLTHEYQNGLCIHCGLNEGAETQFRYDYDYKSQTVTIRFFSGNDWYEKETVILPTVCFVTDVGVVPCTGIGKELFSNNLNIKHIVIPEGYTYIGKNCFDHTLNLEEINLPSTMKTIDESAFIGDYKLKKVVFPTGMESIGKSAFDYCSKLAEIELPACTKLGDYAFARTALTRVVLPEGLTVIPIGLFTGCQKLTEVVVPSSVTAIYSGAFEYTALSSFAVSENVTVLCLDAFTGTQIRELYVPDTVTKCATGISDCPKLETLHLPESVTELSGYSLSNMPSLRSLNIPNGLQKITYLCLTKCPSLTDVQIADDHPCFTVSDGMLIDKNTHTLIKILGSTENLVIPDDGSVTALTQNLAEGLTTLKSVIIPASIERIPSMAFKNCIGLESVTLAEGVKYIDYYAFYGCKSLKSFVFPATACTVGPNILENCSSLEEVTFPLTFNNQPDRYTLDNMLTGCTSLHTIYFGGKTDGWDSFTHQDGLYYCIPAGIKVICADGVITTE